MDAVPVVSLPYMIILDLVRFLTGFGIVACAVLLWLLSRHPNVLPGLRIFVSMVGVTLLVLLVTDLVLIEVRPEDWLTLARRTVGRTILSSGAVWFLYTCLRVR